MAGKGSSCRRAAAQALAAAVIDRMEERLPRVELGPQERKWLENDLASTR
jgi:hypothetical protein